MTLVDLAQAYLMAFITALVIVGGFVFIVKMARHKAGQPGKPMSYDDFHVRYYRRSTTHAARLGRKEAQGGNRHSR